MNGISAQRRVAGNVTTGTRPPSAAAPKADGSGASTKRQIIIHPNASLSTPQSAGAFAGLACLALAVGLTFAWSGFWPVLAFALLEILGAGAVFYLCAQRAHDREIVSVDEGHVTVERGRMRCEQRRDFPRYWTQVVISRPVCAHHPSRLALRCQGCEIEIGRCLNEDERQALADRLGQMIGPIASTIC